MAGRTSSAVEDVYGVLGSEDPERYGGVAGDKVSTNLFHYAPNGSLGYAIKGVHVRRASGLIYGLGI